MQDLWNAFFLGILVANLGAFDQQLADVIVSASKSIYSSNVV